MRKKLLQNIMFAAMCAWAMYGTGLTAPLGFDQIVQSSSQPAFALR
jgi:hypothetical protein